MNKCCLIINCIGGVGKYIRFSDGQGVGCQIKWCVILRLLKREPWLKVFVAVLGYPVRSPVGTPAMLSKTFPTIS